MRCLTWVLEVFVFLRPKVLIVRKLLQKNVSQNNATGSHTRVSKIEILPKLCLISIVIFEVFTLVSGCFSLTTTKSIDFKETFTKALFSKYCNRKSHQCVKDRNFAEIVLDFTLMVIFEVFNLVSGGFSLTTTTTIDCAETFTEIVFQNIATGSHTRVSKLEILPNSCLISPLMSV